MRLRKEVEDDPQHGVDSQQENTLQPAGFTIAGNLSGYNHGQNNRQNFRRTENQIQRRGPIKSFMNTSTGAAKSAIWIRPLTVGSFPNHLLDL
jgi:hypothetical protein